MLPNIITLASWTSVASAACPGLAVACDGELFLREPLVSSKSRATDSELESVERPLTADFSLTPAVSFSDSARALVTAH